MQKEQLEKLQAIEGLKVEYETIKAQVESKLADQQESLKTAGEADAQLDLARAKSMESMGKRAETQTSIEKLTVNIDNLEEQLQRLYTRQESDNERNEALVKELESKEQEETACKNTLGELEGENIKAKAKQTELGQSIQQLNAKWQSLREKKSSADARLKSFRELRDSYDGFAYGVKAIMQAKQSNNANVQGVIGPIGDLISTQKEYERAVEAVLGGSINNIAIEEAECAKGAIRYLKEKKAGRVTFLPLDTIRSGSRDNIGEVTGKPGVIGSALDVVEFDEKLRPVMEYIFHNTVIVETIDHAISLARSGKPIPRMVSKDGEVVSGSGAVTGGRTKHESRGLLGRSAEIEELVSQVKEHAGGIEKLTAKGQELNDALEAINEKVKTLNQQEEEQRRIISRLGLEIAQASKELRGLSESLTAITTNRDEFYAKRDGYEAARREFLTTANSMTRPCNVKLPKRKNALRVSVNRSPNWRMKYPIFAWL